MAKQDISIPNSRTECRERLIDIDDELLRLKGEQQVIRNQASETDKRLSRLNNEKALIETQLGRIQGDPEVTDHAIIRYLERKYGFDVDAIRQEIMTPELKSAIKAGAAGWKVEGGTFKIVGAKVVTFIRAKQ